MTTDKMKVTPKKISIRDLFDGYINTNDTGAVGYHGLLNIRPSYQREFIYTEKQEKEVINSVVAGFPLNTIYWSVCADGKYELLDGQQRTLSICRYLDGVYRAEIDGVEMYWENLTKEQQEEILNYELDVYWCEGTEKAKLKWFEVINIAGEKLTQQELYNAIFHGSWVDDAKRYFVRGGSSCPAHQVSQAYVSANVERQGLLELALKWASGDGNIESFMAKNQHKKTAVELWQHFRNVIDWAKAIFPDNYREKKGVDWGELYAQYHNKELDPEALGKQVDALMANSEVRRKSGIYYYVLSGDEKYLSLRQFDESDKRSKWTEQKGICAQCNKPVPYEECEADHIKPWYKGGRTDWDNLQVLCRKCNRTKSGK